MILLEGINKSSLVLLFGTGTVGSEIYEALLRYGDWRPSSILYPWDANGRAIRRDFWKKLLRRVGLEYLSQGRAVDVQFIWSAGKAGMLSPFVEIEKERKLMHDFDIKNKMTQMTAQKLTSMELPFPFTNETKHG